MARLALLLCVLLISGASAFNPGVGASADEWSVTVRDAALTTSWAIISEGGATFTQVAADTQMNVAWPAQSVLDSLRSGNGGVGTLTGIYDFTNTADQTVNANFLRDRSGKVLSFINSPFSKAGSPRYGAWRGRWADADYKLGATWTFVAIAGGWSAGNPGVGKVQTLFSLGHSASVIDPGPQQLRLDYLPGGQISVVYSGAFTSGIDSVVSATDTYNSAYHLYVFGLSSSTLSLAVDNGTAVTKALSKNLSPLESVDSVGVWGTWRGANLFRGRIDELYLTESAAPFTTELKTYLNRRLAEARDNIGDSAQVWTTGLKAADSTYAVENLRVPLARDTTTAYTYKLFQAAWADTDEALPLIVFPYGFSPRQALLDSIPANLIHAPVGHVVFGKRDNPVWLGAFAAKTDTCDTVRVELRVYPDWKDARTPTTGYYVLWQDILTDAHPEAQINREVALPKPGYVALYARASNAAGSALTFSAWGKRTK